jgi:two-component system nitrogen regulation response regulator GlnG
VRELENLIRRLAVLYSEETIEEAIIERELAGARGRSTEEPGAEGGEPDLARAVERFLDRFFRAYDQSSPPAAVYDRVLREIERPLITRTLQLTRGNQLKAADILGLNRNTLRKKIRELDIPIVRGP